MTQKTTPPVDPNDLAALIDGRLEGEAKARVLRLVAADEDALTLLADSAETLRDLEGTKQIGIPHSGLSEPAESEAIIPFRPRWKTFSAALATAVAAMVILLIYRAPDKEPVPSSSDLLAAYSSPIPDLTTYIDHTLGPVFRGEDSLVSSPGNAFRLGVRTLDLQLALQTQDRLTGIRWALEIQELLPSVVTLPELHQANYSRIEQNLGQSVVPQSTLGDTIHAESDLENTLKGSVLRVDFLFGRWVEANRLAALGKQRAYFSDNAALNRSLDYFVASYPTEAISAPISHLQNALTVESEELDLPVLAAQLQNLVDHCSGHRCFQEVTLPP